MLQIYNQFKTSLITLTRLPLVEIDTPDYDLKNSLWCFPLVGLLIGLILVCFTFFAQLVNLPTLLGAVLTCLLLCIITGALHEDGLADFIDSFGANEVAKRLNIMRDSQIGTYGSLALIFITALRIGAFYTLWETELLAIAIIFSLMLSRSAIGLLVIFTKPARDNGLAASLKNIEPMQIWASQAIIFGFGFVFIGFNVLTFMIAITLIVYLIAQLTYKHIGGYTGDVLGACEQISQIIGLLIFSTFL